MQEPCITLQPTSGTWPWEGRLDEPWGSGDERCEDNYKMPGAWRWGTSHQSYNKIGFSSKAPGKILNERDQLWDAGWTWKHELLT